MRDNPVDRGYDPSMGPGDEDAIDHGDAAPETEGRVSQGHERLSAEQAYKAWLKRQDATSAMVHPDAVDDDDGDDELDDE